jgi:hypothetical protein
MRRITFIQSCILSFGAICSTCCVHAEDIGLPHFSLGKVHFNSALDADHASREGFLNSLPDADLLKGQTAKKGDGTAKATVTIFGSIANNQGSPLCGLILANGQFMFSCSPNGTYSLSVPQDSAGQVTLFGFVDGHFPYKRVLSSAGRYDMTLNVASFAPPPAVTTSTITFALTDGCNNGVSIDYKFYDFANNLVWPTSSTHYVTQAYNATYTHDLSCNTGANVCYGARSLTLYWGVDVDGSKSCADCCISCQSGNSLSRRLTC